MRVESIQKAAFGIISQTAIHYRESPLSESADRLPSGAPQAGDRFPWLKVKLAPTGAIEDLFEALDDTRFNLLVIGQPAPPADALEAAGPLRLHTIPVDSANQAALERAGIAAPSYYLLRPDGHVGLCGIRVDVATITRYLAERLNLLDASRT